MQSDDDRERSYQSGMYSQGQEGEEYGDDEGGIGQDDEYENYPEEGMQKDYEYNGEE